MVRWYLDSGFHRNDVDYDDRPWGNVISGHSIKITTYFETVFKEPLNKSLPISNGRIFGGELEEFSYSKRAFTPILTFLH